MAQQRQAERGGTYQDALAAWNWLTQEKRLAPERIVLFGESLGRLDRGLALAARHKPAGLVHLRQLHFRAGDGPGGISPVSGIPPGALSFTTRGGLGSVNCPVLILHSREDEVVPFATARHCSKRRASRSACRAARSHNDALLLSREVYAREVEAFLQASYEAERACYALIPAGILKRSRLRGRESYSSILNWT